MSKKPTLAYLMPDEMRTACFRPRDIDRLEASVEPIGGPIPDGKESLPAEALAQAEILVTGWGSPPIKGDTLASAKRLRFVQHAAGSVRNLIDDDLFDRGVRLSSCNHALAAGVAHMILGFLIVAGKRGWTIPPLVRAGHWSRKSDELMAERNERIIEMFDIDVGVVSASLVGRELMKLLQQFEVNVLVYDPTLSNEEAARLGAEKVGLDTLLRRSDMISLCAPALPETRHMFSAREFSLMKDTAIFINTSRGQNVDEDALVAELRKDRLFAIIDVTDPEPPREDHPLLSLPNCIMTNHIAGHATNGRFRQGQYAVDEILRFVRGEPLVNEITRERFRTMA